MWETVTSWANLTLTAKREYAGQCHFLIEQQLRISPESSGGKRLTPWVKHRATQGHAALLRVLPVSSGSENAGRGGLGSIKLTSFDFSLVFILYPECRRKDFVFIYKIKYFHSPHVENCIFPLSIIWKRSKRLDTHEDISEVSSGSHAHINLLLLLLWRKYEEPQGADHCCTWQPGTGNLLSRYFTYNANMTRPGWCVSKVNSDTITAFLFFFFSHYFNFCFPPHFSILDFSSVWCAWSTFSQRLPFRCIFLLIISWSALVFSFMVLDFFSLTSSSYGNQNLLWQLCPNSG